MAPAIPRHLKGNGAEVIWNVVAFSRTRSTNGATVKRGEALALEAERRTKNEALWRLLTKGNEIMKLQSRDWVLSHSESEVMVVVSDLAGEEEIVKVSESPLPVSDTTRNRGEAEFQTTDGQGTIRHHKEDRR